MEQKKRPTLYVLVVGDEGDFPHLYLDHEYLESDIEPPDVLEKNYKCVIDSDLNYYDVETDGRRCRIVKNGTTDEATLMALLKRSLAAPMRRPRSFRIPESVLDKLDLPELCQMAAPFAADGTGDKRVEMIAFGCLGSVVGVLAALGCGLFRVLNDVGTLTFIVTGAVLGGAWGLVDNALHRK